MSKNVAILPSGLSLGSVLGGLLVRADYWPGAETDKKEDYDTFENRELIRLNMRLFEEAGADQIGGGKPPILGAEPSL